MGVLVMLLACLTIIGTAMSTPIVATPAKLNNLTSILPKGRWSTPIVATPTKLNNLTSILPKGWTTDDLVRALASKGLGHNVSRTQDLKYATN